MHDGDLSVQINASQHRWLQCVGLYTQIHGKIPLSCKQDEKIQYLENIFLDFSYNVINMYVYLLYFILFIIIS